MCCGVNHCHGHLPCVMWLPRGKREHHGALNPRRCQLEAEVVLHGVLTKKITANEIMTHRWLWSTLGFQTRENVKKCTPRNQWAARFEEYSSFHPILSLGVHKTLALIFLWTACVFSRIHSEAGVGTTQMWAHTSCGVFCCCCSQRGSPGLWVTW